MRPDTPGKVTLRPASPVAIGRKAACILDLPDLDAPYAPEAFGKHTAAEVEKWKKVATDAKLSLD